MSVAIEYDSPWKEALRLFLRSFMRLCFPGVERVIDWRRTPQFLDKELQQILRDAETGRLGSNMLTCSPLYRLIDWLLRLPDELEARFRQQVHEYEQKQNMPYVTSIEQYGMEKGRAEGQLINCRENILDLLAARFGSAPLAIRERLEEETDLARRRGSRRLAGTCAKLEEFRTS